MLKITYTSSTRLNNKLSNQELENKILENEISLILNESNHQRLLSPLSEKIIKDIVKSLRKMQGVPTEGVPTEIWEVFSSKKNIEKFISFPFWKERGRSSSYSHYQSCACTTSRVTNEIYA